MQTLAFGMPGPMEWLIIGLIGLLLFGKRLPEVGRSVGKTIVEFKKGMKEVQDDVTQVDELPPPSPRAHLSNTQPNTQPQPKFDPYTGKPLDQTQSQETQV
jgi:sec-independent protein translocase protein TatA